MSATDPSLQSNTAGPTGAVGGALAGKRVQAPRVHRADSSSEAAAGFCAGA